MDIKLTSEQSDGRSLRGMTDMSFMGRIDLVSRFKL